MFLHDFPAYVCCADAPCPGPVQQDDVWKKARDAQPSQHVGITHTHTHTRQELRIPAWLQTQDSSTLVKQAVRNLSNTQRELNAQKILRPTNLCFSKIPQHRYMSVVY